MRKDIGRNRYYTPEEAVDYGLIDRVVQPDDPVAFEAKDYEALLQKAQVVLPSHPLANPVSPPFILVSSWLAFQTAVREALECGRNSLPALHNVSRLKWLL